MKNQNQTQHWQTSGARGFSSCYLSDRKPYFAKKKKKNKKKPDVSANSMHLGLWVEAAVFMFSRMQQFLCVSRNTGHLTSQRSVSVSKISFSTQKKRKAAFLMHITPSHFSFCLLRLSTHGVLQNKCILPTFIDFPSKRVGECRGNAFRFRLDKSFCV